MYFGISMMTGLSLLGNNYQFLELFFFIILKSVVSLRKIVHIDIENRRE